MSQSFASSLAPILAAPWHQRRNRNGVWGLALIVALCVLPPLGLLAWALLGDPLMAPALLHSAAIAGRLAALALSLAGWAMTVNNVLEQNHPMLARVVPGHPRRLRAALLVAWAVLGALLVDVVFAGVVDPVTGFAIAAPTLAALAACVRWPWLWVTTFIAPYAVNDLLRQQALSGFKRAMLEAWQAQPAAIAATLAALSAVAIGALIQAGGRRHAATYETRRTRMLRFQAASRGERLRSDGAMGVVDGLLNAPYYRWMQRLLARPAGSTRARGLLALGLGPAIHWTVNVTALLATAVTIAAALALALLLVPLFPQVGEFLPTALASVAIGAMFGLVSPGGQVQSRLHQTRREQALLVLLPGVPRGAALGRWLSVRMTAQYLLSWAGAAVLMMGYGTLAEHLRQGDFDHAYGGARLYMLIATLPLVVFQWRRWARVAEPTTLSALWPTLLGGLLAALAVAGQRTELSTLAESATAFALGALAWCALRWRRMRTEPPALPIGRLA